MNLRKRKTHSVSFHYWGWTARPFSRGLTVVGEVFVLTSLFIERRYRNVAHAGTDATSEVIEFARSAPSTLPENSTCDPASRTYTLCRVFCTEYMTADSKRPLSNPLALAILVLLYERPMHPYEMATTLRERHKENSIRLNYGALYAVIEQLLRQNFIAVREVLKEGRRPMKTVYQLRSLGEAELIDWMRELVSSPVKEYPMFEAALSLLPVLPPEEVIELLEIRIGLLEKTIEEIDKEKRNCREMKLPRLFSLESEYYEAITLAEYEFSKDLLGDLKRDAGKLRSGWTELRKGLLATKETERTQQAPRVPIRKNQKRRKDNHERKNT